MADNYIQGPVECRVCGHQWRDVAPWPNPGLNNLECPRCGCMAGDLASPDDDCSDVGF